MRWSSWGIPLNGSPHPHPPHPNQDPPESLTIHTRARPSRPKSRSRRGGVRGSWGDPLRVTWRSMLGGIGGIPWGEAPVGTMRDHRGLPWGIHWGPQGIQTRPYHPPPICLACGLSLIEPLSVPFSPNVAKTCTYRCSQASAAMPLARLLSGVGAICSSCHYSCIGCCGIRQHE